MSIAEKLLRAKADLDAVYEAGKAAGDVKSFHYGYAGINIARLFYNAVFPEKSEITFELRDNTTLSIMELFRVATGFRKLTLVLPTDRAYNATYCLYGASVGTSTLEELILPDGIEFSKFPSFAQNCVKLRTITGTINLSASTDNENCFNKCGALEEVRFVKQSITKSISFAEAAKLSDDSIASIINGLSSDAIEQVLIVHPDVAARITEKDVTDTGWTLAY